MKYLLDTCVISDFVKGHHNVLQRIKSEPPDNLAISSVVFMEIQFGLALNPARAKKITPIINTFLELIYVLPYNEEDAFTTATIRAQLKKQGNPIGPYDIMIAGCALNRQLIAVTSNTNEFQRIDGLAIENWQ